MNNQFLKNADPACLTQILHLLGAENEILALVSPSLHIVNQTTAAAALLSQNTMSPIGQVLSAETAAGLREAVRQGTETTLYDTIDGQAYRIDCAPVGENSLLRFSLETPTPNPDSLRDFLSERVGQSLSLILMAQEGLKNTPGDKLLLQTIKQSALRINRTLRHVQLLTASPAELQPDLVEDDLCQLVQGLTAAFRVRTDKIQLQTTVPDACRAVFDRTLLTIALANLLTNAAEAKGTTTVSLSLRHQNGQILLRVAGDGRPLPAARLDSLYMGYRRPYSGECLLTDAMDGVRWGLGLPLVRLITSLHSGLLLASSDEKLGTDFTIVFSDHLPANHGLRQGDGLTVEDGVDPLALEFSVLPTRETSG